MEKGPLPQNDVAPDRRVAGFTATLGHWIANPTVYFEYAPAQKTLAYLIGNDLSIADRNLSADPEERALQFVLRHAHVFGLDQTQLNANLFLKKALTSRMGRHYIFGLRSHGIEADAELFTFVVHLDRDNCIVMVTAVYNVDYLKKLFGLTITLSDPADVLKVVSDRMKQRDLAEAGSAHVELMLVQRRQQPSVPTPGYQVKIYKPTGHVKVMHVFDFGGGNLETSEPYTICSAAAPRLISWGTVYRDFWSPGEAPLSHAKMSEEKLKEVLNVVRPTKKVVLRDLNSTRELIGRYVKVENCVIPLALQPASFECSADLGSWLFDPVMAYYHTDLARRYFRDLGLDVLDEYEQFNPMTVVLDPKVEQSLYNSVGQKIHIKQLRITGAYATNVREPRILYHEFVHAITDALARLQRTAKDNDDSPRLRCIREATSMDEGLADYFACSLAARAGATEPTFYLLEVKKRPDGDPVPPGDTAVLTWEHKRELGANVDPTVWDRKGEYDPYQWGTQWGRYLWKLRCVLGTEIADTIIAHSIFFLTRWSSFSMGVLAIVLADRLLFGADSTRKSDGVTVLFGGAHEKEILAARPKVGGKEIWNTWQFAQPGN